MDTFDDADGSAHKTKTGQHELRAIHTAEFVGALNTYDISIEHPDHLFLLHNGLIVSNSIGEPITQSALNTKHQGGMTTGKREFSGFNVISQFSASPENFPDRAAVAEQDGKVTKIEEAAQGGHYVHVNNKAHYVLPGYDVTAKQGDAVEAGDALSDGLVDPGDVVRLRGLGEGRKYYTDRLQKILGDSGMPADRRNVEMLARAALNHVVVEDPEGMADYLPDDVASYSRISGLYTPPEDAAQVKASDAEGQFLHAPALHYTIGTRLTPRIAKHLDEKYGAVVASPTAPAFRPEMSNLRTASHSTTDWMSAQHTSHLKSHFIDSAVRGEDASLNSSHFAGPLARGATFGDNVETTGKF